MAFIRKLRKKIEPQPDSPEYIITILGIVYKFNENKKKGSHITMRVFFFYWIIK
jgi:DNA-binding winged helix-turn-helix (wHTH) protein